MFHPFIAGATLVDNFTIRGNSLGSQDWGGDSTWFTGYGQSGKEEQLDCGARFKFDINVYLNTSASKYKTIQARHPLELRRAWWTMRGG